MWVYQQRKDYIEGEWKHFELFDVGFYVENLRRSDFVVVESFETKELARSAAHFLNGGS